MHSLYRFVIHICSETWNVMCCHTLVMQGGRNSDDTDRGKVSSSARPVHGTAQARGRTEQMPSATPPGEYGSKLYNNLHFSA